MEAFTVAIPSQQFALGANYSDVFDPIDHVDFAELDREMTFNFLDQCKWGCWVYLIISGIFVVGHLYMMLGPLHAWAEANFSLLSLTLWSFFSLAISLLYVMKVQAWFMLDRWVRRLVFAFMMTYTCYYFAAVVDFIVNLFRGVTPSETTAGIVLAYLMVLGFPAATWSTYVTFDEALSGDLMSDR